jgi:hypothetical protein
LKKGAQNVETNIGGNLELVAEMPYQFFGGETLKSATEQHL